MAVKAAGGGTGFARSSQRILLRDGVRLADVTDGVGSVAWDYAVGAVAEMSFPAVDVGGRLAAAGLLTAGTTLTYEAAPWQVAAVERDYRRPDVWVTVTARSQLARRLRNMVGPDKSDGKVTPQQWITTRARKAGAQTVRVQAGASRRVITQKRNESVLAVIESLASDTGTEWVEYDGCLYVGTAWWALHDLGLREWVAPLDGPRYADDLAVAGLTTRSSIDDRQEAATATLTVESATGIQVRPWQRVRLVGADQADNGLWLVTQNTWDDSTPSATITLSRPLKSSPKKGSTGTESTDDTGGLTPIPGSSFTDARRPSNWAGRSVTQILNIHRNNPGGLNHTIYNGCLWYAQEVAGYSHIGSNPHVLWVMLATAKRHTSRSVVPGAVMLFRNSRIGHAVVYLGGGRALSTDMDSSGNYAPGKWSVGPADASWFGSFLGWYSPP